MESMDLYGFSPRNGEVILKPEQNYYTITCYRFSPRNGEVILKGTP